MNGTAVIFIISRFLPGLVLASLLLCYHIY